MQWKDANYYTNLIHVTVIRFGGILEGLGKIFKA